MKAMIGALALVGFGAGMSMFVERESQRERYIKQNLELNAPFLGLQPNYKYLDTDGNGKLETYTRINFGSQEFSVKVTRNEDGSFALTQYKDVSK